MKYELHYTKSFKQDLRLLVKSHFDAIKLSKVLKILQYDIPIKDSYKDHPFKGNWKGFRELHIQFSF